MGDCFVRVVVEYWAAVRTSVVPEKLRQVGALQNGGWIVPMELAERRSRMERRPKRKQTAAPRRAHPPMLALGGQEEVILDEFARSVGFAFSNEISGGVDVTPNIPEQNATHYAIALIIEDAFTKLLFPISSHGEFRVGFADGFVS